MPRPDQQGKGKRSKAHKDKHGGEIVEGRHAKGAFAEGNQLAKGHGERVSAGKQLRNALRDQVGEQRVRDLVDELYKIAMGAEQETKDRLKAIDTIFGYTIGKPSGTSALEVTNDNEGNQTVRFLVVGGDGEEREV